MNDGEAGGGARLDQNEPNCVADDQGEVHGQDGGAGSVGKEDEADTDDEIYQTGAKIE